MMKIAIKKGALLALIGISTHIYVILGSSAGEELSVRAMALAYIKPEEEDAVVLKYSNIFSYCPEAVEDELNLARTFLMFKMRTNVLRNKKAAIDRARKIMPSFDTIVDQEQQKLIKMVDSNVEAEQGNFEKEEDLFYKPARDMSYLKRQKNLLKGLAIGIKMTNMPDQIVIVQQEYPRLVEVYTQGANALRQQLGDCWDFYDPSALDLKEQLQPKRYNNDVIAACRWALIRMGYRGEFLDQ